MRCDCVNGQRNHFGFINPPREMRQRQIGWGYINNDDSDDNDNINDSDDYDEY